MSARCSSTFATLSTVTLRLAAADLAYWDVGHHAWTVEPGRADLMVGPSSADADLKLRRTVAVTP
jgi:hypothetical protein